MRDTIGSSGDGPAPLHEVLSILHRDVMRRTVPLTGDNRAEVRGVVRNNLRILELLDEAIKLAEQSNRTVDAIVPSRR